MKTMQEWIADYAESKSSEIYQTIIEQLQTVNKLWTAYSPVTKNHYMEYFQGRPTAFLFSERQFCESFREHLQTHRVKIEPELCKTEDRLLLFSDLYRSGVEHILLDNGQQFICIPLFDVIDKPDFSAFSEKDRPVVNPSLMVSADWFFQTFDAGTATKNTRKKMLRELYRGTYLMPVLTEEAETAQTVSARDGTPVTIPAVALENGETLLPFFTDWTEFSRFDKEKQLAGSVVSFRDIEYLCEQNETIAVNPFGFNMVIDKNALALIKKVSADIILPEEEEVTLFELRSVPNDMIQALMALLDRTDGVKTAYLKGIARQDRTGYLVIVDAEGTDPSMFEEMAQQVGTYAQGASVEFVGFHTEFGRQAAETTYPFFQKAEDMR